MSQHAIAWIILAAVVVATAATITWEAGAGTAVRRARRRRELARAVATVDERHGPGTRPIDLGGLVIPPHGRVTGRCQWCRTEGPDDIARGDCTCSAPCGESWCGAGVAA